MNTLRLTIMEKNQVITFQRDIVLVGRDVAADLRLSDKIMVARRHAMFIYENGGWYLQDNFSTNGTWLNGVRIEAGKRYLLAANDEINFAMAEQVVFDKQ